jgi:hypothetical protein
VIRTVFGGHDQRERGVKINALRIAMAVAPDFRARIGLADERIVGGNRAIRVEAEDFSGERIEALGIWRTVSVAGGDVEHTIRPEAQAPTCVIQPGGNAFDDCPRLDELIPGFAIAHDPQGEAFARRIVLRGVNEMVRRKSRIMRQAEQSHFHADGDIGEPERGNIQQLALLNYPDLTEALGKKKPTIGEKIQSPRGSEILRHDFHAIEVWDVGGFGTGSLVCANPPVQKSDTRTPV